jgi:hypothetical protein
VKHHTADDNDCERREDQKGWWAWFKRNMTIAVILAVGAGLMSIIAWRDNKVADIKSGVEAATTVKMIEKDYIGKRELENVTTTLHTRISKVEDRLEKMGDKFDSLKDVIMERLPDKPSK